MDTEEAIVISLRERFRQAGPLDNPERAHEFRPATWQRWLENNPAAMSVVEDHSDNEGKHGGKLTRADLLQLSTQADSNDQESLIRLFTATMIWGSGTSNGRGPRYTQAALDDPRLVPSLIDTRQMIHESDPAAAYKRFRSEGVGSAFFTKWFWAVGLGKNLHPTPLILDARVWASLGILGWNSREAAGSRRWALRYVAYLEAMDRWAASGLPGVTTPEQLEQRLFHWRGETAVTG